MSSRCLWDIDRKPKFRTNTSHTNINIIEIKGKSPLGNVKRSPVGKILGAPNIFPRPTLNHFRTIWWSGRHWKNIFWSIVDYWLVNQLTTGTHTHTPVSIVTTARLPEKMTQWSTPCILLLHSLQRMGCDRIKKKEKEERCCSTFRKLPIWKSNVNIHKFQANWHFKHSFYSLAFLQPHNFSYTHCIGQYIH